MPRQGHHLADPPNIRVYYTSDILHSVTRLRVGTLCKHSQFIGRAMSPSKYTTSHGTVREHTDIGHKALCPISRQQNPGIL